MKMAESGYSMDPTHSITKVIAELRREKGMSLEDLADRAGLDRSALGLIERGKRGLTIKSAARIAGALELSLDALLKHASAGEGHYSVSSKNARILPDSVLRNQENLRELTGLSAAAIRHAVEYVYETLDLIDKELTLKGSEPISALVELANLSSMIGNLVGAGVAAASDGLYLRNRPHAFPDLVPQHPNLPDLEIKTALESNSPKGHLPKEGVYLTFRYCLGGPNGEYTRGKDGRGLTVWIWEVRVGYLKNDDFAISNTEGDSGKTAVVKSASFQSMHVVFFDPRFFPYAKTWAGLNPNSESGS
jgi:transcriptional regulator with XRE-family HTH domain